MLLVVQVWVKVSPCALLKSLASRSPAMSEDLVSRVPLDLEGHIGGRRGFDLEGDAVDGEVLAEKVVGRLSEILHALRSDVPPPT